VRDQFLSFMPPRHSLSLTFTFTETLSHGVFPASSPSFYYSGAVCHLHLHFTLCFRTLSYGLLRFCFHFHLQLFLPFCSLSLFFKSNGGVYFLFSLCFFFSFTSLCFFFSFFFYERNSWFFLKFEMKNINF
jgi:hypothetical protein